MRRPVRMRRWTILSTMGMRLGRRGSSGSWSVRREVRFVMFISDVAASDLRKMGRAGLRIRRDTRQRWLY